MVTQKDLTCSSWFCRNRARWWGHGYLGAMRAWCDLHRFSDARRIR